MYGLRRLLPLLLLAVTAGPAPAQAPDKVIVGTRASPPFAFRDEDGSWQGLSISLWHDIAAQLDLEFEIREFDLKGLLEATEKGEIDVAVAALSVTPEREERMDFSHPFHNSGLGIAVPAQTKSGGFSILGALLSTRFLEALGILLGVLAIGGLLVWIFERRRNAEQFGRGRTLRGVGDGFWWSAVTMTTVGYGDKAPRTPGGRLVALVWMFVGIVVIATLTGTIASALTADALTDTIREPDDLFAHRVACVAGSTAAEYLVENGIRTRTARDVHGAMQLVAVGGADAAVHDAPMLRYLALTEFGDDVRVLPFEFRRQEYALALPEAGGRREQLNRALLRTVERDRWHKLVARYLGR